MFCDIPLVSFSENLKQLTKITKINHFSILFAFFMKTVGFCTIFIADTNSACKKYPDKHTFIEFAAKAQFTPNSLQFRPNQFSQNFEKC